MTPEPNARREVSDGSSAATSTDYARILDLIDRIEGSVRTVRDALPERTLVRNILARNHAAQIEVDVRELQTLLLDRHLLIQREAESNA